MKCVRKIFEENVNIFSYILNSLMKIVFLTKTWTFVLILSYSFFNDRYMELLRNLSKSEQNTILGREYCRHISQFYELFVFKPKFYLQRPNYGSFIWLCFWMIEKNLIKNVVFLQYLIGGFDDSVTSPLLKKRQFIQTFNQTKSSS